MTPPSYYKQWRRRLIGLRPPLVLSLVVAMIAMYADAPSPMPLAPFLWLGALLLPSLPTLFTLHWPAHRQQQLLALELTLDVLLFLGVLRHFGGAANPISFYLLIPLLLGALTLTTRAAAWLLLLTVCGYVLVGVWHALPVPDSAMQALMEMSPAHLVGMAAIFLIMALLLTVLGQVIQGLERRQHRHQERMIELAARRERLYQVAASLANQAHELNTPLSTLVMLADNARREPQLPEPVREDLEQIEALARRVAGQLRQHENRSFPERLSFTDLVTELKRHLRHLHPTLTITTEGNLECPFSHGADWFRVLTNLGYNAIDAGAGELLLRLDSNGPQRRLTVSDDGPTHPERRRDDGLGVGLALVETTLETLGARLTLTLEPRLSRARIDWSEHELA